MDRCLHLSASSCAVTEDGVLVEYIRLDGQEQTGDILMAKAGRIMPGLECVFTDIGRAKAGFLPLKENSLTFRDTPIHSGDRFPVQVKKEENGEKGAYLTRDLTFPGQYVILMPMNRYIGVSSRVKDPAERQRLLETGQRISGGGFGLVMREAALPATEDEIRGETRLLQEKWDEVRRKASEASAPGTILYSADIRRQLTDDYSSRGPLRILETEETEPMITEQLRKAADRRVTLTGGGNIVIDRCEAMTVIDVNTASSVLENKDATVLSVNLEACAAIAAQVRLRNICGIILIDFIDMDTSAQRDAVQERITEAFAADRRKTVIHGWTNLGLLEMTRKRN